MTRRTPQLRLYPGADGRYAVAGDGEAWSCCSGDWRPLKFSRDGKVSIRMADGRIVNRTARRLQRETWLAPAATPVAADPSPTLADIGRRLDILLAATPPAPDLAPLLARLDALEKLVRSLARPAAVPRPAVISRPAANDRVAHELQRVVGHLGLTETASILGVGGAALRRVLSGETATAKGIDEGMLHRLAVIIEHDAYDDEDDFADLQAAVARARRGARRVACEVAAWSEAS